MTKKFSDAWEKRIDAVHAYLNSWCDDCSKRQKCHNMHTWKYYSPTLCYRKGKGFPWDCRNFVACEEKKHLYRKVDVRHADVISLCGKKDMVL